MLPCIKIYLGLMKLGKSFFNYQRNNRIGQQGHNGYNTKAIAMTAFLIFNLELIKGLKIKALTGNRPMRIPRQRSEMSTVPR